MLGSAYHTQFPARLRCVGDCQEVAWILDWGSLNFILLPVKSTVKLCWFKGCGMRSDSPPSALQSNSFQCKVIAAQVTMPARCCRLYCCSCTCSSPAWGPGLVLNISTGLSMFISVNNCYLPFFMPKSHYVWEEWKLLLVQQTFHTAIKFTEGATYIAMMGFSLQETLPPRHEGKACQGTVVSARLTPSYKFCLLLIRWCKKDVELNIVLFDLAGDQSRSLTGLNSRLCV